MPCRYSSLAMSYLTHVSVCVLVSDDICAALVDVTKRVWLKLASASMVNEANSDSTLSHFLYYRSASVRAHARVTRSDVLPHTCKVLGK